MLKKSFCISALCFFLAFSPCGEIISSNITLTAEAKTYVYYVPNSSYAYHAHKKCWTLSRSKTIKKITLKKAKKLDLKPCDVCYK